MGFPQPVIAFTLAGIYSAAAFDVVRLRVTGDAADRFVVNADGTVEWGSGSAATDVTLARVGTSTARLSGFFQVTNDVIARNAAATQVIIGNEGPATEAGISFGSAVDTSLYRAAANILRTDDQFICASLGVANTAAATTLGTVTDKLPIVDATATLIGYIPIYDAIT